MPAPPATLLALFCTSESSGTTRAKDQVHPWRTPCCSSWPRHRAQRLCGLPPSGSGVSVVAARAIACVKAGAANVLWPLWMRDMCCRAMAAERDLRVVSRRCWCAPPASSAARCLPACTCCFVNFLRSRPSPAPIHARAKPEAMSSGWYARVRSHVQALWSGPLLGFRQGGHLRTFPPSQVTRAISGM